jgi:hypothetical protein
MRHASQNERSARLAGLALSCTAILGCSSNTAPAGDGGLDGPEEAAMDRPQGTPDGAVLDASPSAPDATARGPEASTPDASSPRESGSPPAGTGIGDSCLFASDCPAGVSCDYLFCSKPCSADADCAGSHAGGRNAQGTANHCVLVVNAIGATVPICDPGCAGANDCLALGQYCRSTQAVSAGPATMVCWQTP